MTGHLATWLGFSHRAVLLSMVAALITAPVSLAQAGSPAAEELPLMQLEEVTDLIMSPGCDYIYTLTLCPSAEAAQMREIVKDKLVAGESREQILGYFEQVYGPRVLAQPAKRGFYFVAWWFPYFLIADIFVIVGVVLFVWRRRARSAEPAAEGSDRGESAAEAHAIDDLIEEEVRKFRDE